MNFQPQKTKKDAKIKQGDTHAESAEDENGMKSPQLQRGCVNVGKTILYVLFFG